MTHRDIRPGPRTSAVDKTSANIDRHFWRAFETPVSRTTHTLDAAKSTMTEQKQRAVRSGDDADDDAHKEAIEFGR